MWTVGRWPCISGSITTEVNIFNTGKISAEQEGIDLSAAMGPPLQFCWKYLRKLWGFLITVPLAKLDKGRSTERGRREKENGQALDYPSPTPMWVFFVKVYLLFKTPFKPHLLCEALPDLSRYNW